MAQLLTTLGPLNEDQLGLMLPHEHVFVDLRTCQQPGYAVADTGDVLRLMLPELRKAQAVGVTALVECTPVGVGRRVDILKAVSEASGLPLVVPTGIYREPWVPPWAHQAGEDELVAWMLSELTEQIEATGVQAAWIKLSAGDDGITAVEAKILRAAGRAGAATGAVIGSHTFKGAVVLDQLAILEAAGYTAERFIWIHASAEPDWELNREVAARGAYIEYDWIGSDNSDAMFIDRILRLSDAGFMDNILLSHDRGWYDPAQPGGGTPRPYTYLSETFVPLLARAGLDQAAVRRLTHDNPFRAFAR